MSELDKWFPRTKKAAVPVERTTAENFRERLEATHDNLAHGGYAAGQAREEFASGPRPSRRKRKPKPGSAKSLERIGEGLARDTFKNQLGIMLTKIPTGYNWAGHPLSTDVDFQGSYQGRPLKVEAKAWWCARKSFPLARFSVNERRYLNNGVAQGWQCWVTIALLDGEPRRGACNNLYVLPWSRWLQIEAELRQRAKGNYEGKSFRRRDLDLLDGLAIVRQGRRWVVPEGHWLAVGQ